jgi:hypothetical protein
MSQVRSWRALKAPPESMILVDRMGELLGHLREALSHSPAPKTAVEIEGLIGRFLNWFLFGLNVLERGEHVRAHMLLGASLEHLLWFVRLRDHALQRWFSPSKNVEHEINPDALARYASCTGSLEEEHLRVAYRSAWSWANEHFRYFKMAHRASLPDSLIEAIGGRVQALETLRNTSPAPTPPTPYAEVNERLDDILHRLREVFGNKLVGLYLYGSLVTGDFDRSMSDIDLLAVTATEVDDRELQQLRELHEDFQIRHAQWPVCMEVAYLPAEGLQTFKSRRSRIAKISPGEPLHFTEAGLDWIINFYTVREYGVPLFGPRPENLIAPISKQEFVRGLEEHMRQWPKWIGNSVRPRKFQAYAILTMCRGLYAHRHGEQVSKTKAALWAAEAFPEWSAPIGRALAWREQWRDENVNHQESYPETREFVNFAVNQIP